AILAQNSNIISGNIFFYFWRFDAFYYVFYNTFFPSGVWQACVSITADADQQDLFYLLVDEVLGEIEEAKKHSRTPSPDLTEESMPSADDSILTPSLMEHIDSFHFDPRQTYTQPFYDSCGALSPQSLPYMSPPPSHLHQNERYIEDLLEDDEEDVEYLKFVETNENQTAILNHVTPCYQGERQYAVEQNCAKDDTHDTHHNDDTNSVKSIDSDCRIKQNRSVSGGKSDYQLNVQEIKKEYSDLIHLPDMTQYFSPVETSTSSSKQTTHSLQSYSTGHQYEPVQYIQNHEFVEESSCDTTVSEYMNWSIKHPKTWCATEVLDWLYFSAEKYGVDCSVLRGEAFRTVTGEQLCNMTAQDFTVLEPCFGILFHRIFREHLQIQHVTISGYERAQHKSDDQLFSFASPTGSSPSLVSNCMSPGASSEHTSPEMYPHYQHSRDASFEFAPQTASSGLLTPSMVQQQGYNYVLQAPDGQMSYGYEYDSVPFQTPSRVLVKEKYNTATVPRRKPGRPRIKSIPTADELRAQREKKMKSQHLWEFIYDMLNNPSYNPGILKWENQSEGVFRFIQSESVAHLWGTLKSNENMTYEKLSRAMRHYYKRGILERVEGRRLVYKFSRETLEKMKQKKNMQLLEIQAEQFATSSNSSNRNQFLVTSVSSANVEQASFSIPAPQIKRDEHVVATSSYSMPVLAEDLLNNSHA
ncbi:ELF3-like protein, partial [Mya arenaria]